MIYLTYILKRVSGNVEIMFRIWKQILRSQINNHGQACMEIIK